MEQATPLGLADSQRIGYARTLAHRVIIEELDDGELEQGWTQGGRVYQGA
jgi:hypothetical protein